MERAILEFASVLAEVQVDIIPQEDGSIFLVGNESDLEKAAFIISDLGYTVKFNGCSNFVQISDFKKYETVMMTKLPSTELTETKLREVVMSFPKLCLIEQTEGVYAVIGDSLDAADKKLRSLGFMVSRTEMGNFLTVSLLRVKHGAKENCA